MTSDLHTYIQGHQDLHQALLRSQEIMQANLVELTRIQSDHIRDMASLQATISSYERATLEHERAAVERLVHAENEHASLREELKAHLAEERHELRDRAMMTGVGGGAVALIGALTKLLGAW